MPTDCGTFWAETERYHELADTFDRNIELTHPNYITSVGVIGHTFFSYDTWSRTAVKYYEYRGPSI